MTYVLFLELKAIDQINKRGSFYGRSESFSSLKVGVIGDVMLDTYMWGKVERISPEAPVPVVSLKKQELRIGGAGNVALNVQSLGAQVFLLSVMGNDVNGNKLDKLFRQNNIRTDYILKSRNRLTTNKIRRKTRQLAQITSLPYNLRTISSHVTGASILTAVQFANFD